VEVVRIAYNTIGSDGAPDIASGLFLFPLETNKSLPLHAHHHGTTTKDRVPSTLDGGYEIGLFYAGLGQFVVMPDNLGMGVSRGFHPYLHRATEASAGVDMLFAAQEYAEARDDITLTDQLIIAGYSQGGHSAMAMQQEIEANYSEEFDLVASTPMSGPYDLSGAFKEFLLSDEEYFFPGYLLYQIIGNNEVYGDLYESLEDILKEPYIVPAKDFETTGTNIGQLHNELISLLMQNEGASLPIKMYKDDYVNDFILNEDHPFDVALRDNDTYNFTASAPTRLIYCKADDQVPFTNSLAADSILNANGSINVSSIDVRSTADHGECIIPAVQESIRFINQFLQSTPTLELAKALEGVLIFPNPVADYLKISIDDVSIKMEKVRLYNMSASLVKEVNFIRNSSLEISTMDLEPGTYAVEILTSEGTVWKKVIKL